MPTSIVNLDPTQYVQVNSTLGQILLQSLRDEVRIALSDLKPAKSNTAFHTLSGSDGPLPINAIDTNVWALSVTDRSSLIISELDSASVSVSNVVDVSETDLTFETDVVTVLNELSRKLSILIEYEILMHKINLEGES